jgi:hypothetical protein
MTGLTNTELQDAIHGTTVALDTMARSKWGKSLADDVTECRDLLKCLLKEQVKRLTSLNKVAE